MEVKFSARNSPKQDELYFEIYLIKVINLQKEWISTSELNSRQLHSSL